MTPYEVREGFAAGLRTIPGLMVSMYRPANITTPHATVGLPSMEYDTSMSRGLDSFNLQILVYVSRADDALGQSMVDEYMAGHGDRSIKTTLEDKTKTGLSNAMVRVGRAEGGTTSGQDGSEFLAVTFDVLVIASGVS